jgi:hypothetical protein
MRFQVLTAASMKFRVFWDVALCSHVEVHRRFGGAYCVLIIHRPDGEGSKNLLSISLLLRDFTARYPRRFKPSISIVVVYVYSLNGTFCIYVFFFVVNVTSWGGGAVVIPSPSPSSSFPFPFVPLQRRGCLVPPWFLWTVLVPCAGD